ncbi:hypothetical protein [Legionella spiritensis]|uniref:hypothetical protein n=1 Tax=Legionella spiritensis TaxID=452 RepID=UPI000F708680|nr:hypothetical protein [Legionella spiritensis]VEG89608.1 coiled-coil protein [Legionella spiritensis]
MHDIQKERIIKRFLQEISTYPPFSFSGHPLSLYKELAQCLDALESTYGDLLDFTKAEEYQEQWDILVDVLQAGLNKTADSPHSLWAVDIQLMHRQAEMWRDHFILNALPQPDYYHRKTYYEAEIQSGDINLLIEKSRQTMIPIIRSFLPEESTFDPANHQDVEGVICALKEQREATIPDSPEAVTLQNQLTLMEDLDKINQLTAISIPAEPAGHLLYCTLTENAGGITRKISLISLASLHKQLNKLHNTKLKTPEDYIQERKNYRLGIEAILKLPKHGDIKEVQREALALNFSRILGLDTTRSSIITHDGNPALFIPFDDIKLLNEFAKGKTYKTGFGFFYSQTYENYSTINPVGSGLQFNMFIDDFGHSLGLFYLCSDTDGIGGYIQNKGLKNSRSLFIFDQVVMPKNKLGLDSRLSLQPVEFIMMHTRHGQGRNRSLIEDSSMASKFDSLMDLLSQENRLCKYVIRTANLHQRRIEWLEKELENASSPEENRRILEELIQIRELKEDALIIKNVIQERIKKIPTIFPRHDEQIDRIEILKTLILEKLLHNPILFTDTGRPYKHPWTYRHNNSVTEIEKKPEYQVFLITFNYTINPQMVEFLKRKGSHSIRLSSYRSLEISYDDLLALTETILYPEMEATLQYDQNYLDQEDLRQISEAYNGYNNKIIIEAIDRYLEIMADDTSPINEKTDMITRTLSTIKDHLNTSKNKGFASHVLKKLHFDIQLRLQRMIPPESMPEQLNSSFTAALKLDRIAEFNEVLIYAIMTGQWDSKTFLSFLKNCMTISAGATNHDEALQKSQEIADLAEKTVLQFNQTLLLQLIKKNKEAKLIDKNNELGKSTSEHIGTGTLFPEEGTLKITSIFLKGCQVLCTEPGDLSEKGINHFKNGL